MSNFTEELEFTKKELQYIFSEYGAISQMASTDTHLYFHIYGGKKELQVRVGRNSGKVEASESHYDAFAWKDTGYILPLNIGGLK